MREEDNRTLKYLQIKYEETVDKMCDQLLESIHEGYNSPLEPWEIYEEKKRAQTKENFGQFRDRVTRGFELLINEITGRK